MANILILDVPASRLWEIGLWMLLWKPELRNQSSPFGRNEGFPGCRTVTENLRSIGPGVALAILTTSHRVLRWGKCVSNFSASRFSTPPTPPHPQEGHILNLLIPEVFVEDPLWDIHSGLWSLQRDVWPHITLVGGGDRGGEGEWDSSRTSAVQWKGAEVPEDLVSNPGAIFGSIILGNKSLQVLHCTIPGGIWSYNRLRVLFTLNTMQTVELFTLTTRHNWITLSHSPFAELPQKKIRAISLGCRGNSTR